MGKEESEEKISPSGPILENTNLEEDPQKELSMVSRDDHKLLQSQERVYREAHKKNPERWSGKTWDWTPIEKVTLNPQKETVGNEQISWEKSKKRATNCLTITASGGDSEVMWTIFSRLQVCYTCPVVGVLIDRATIKTPSGLHSIRGLRQM